MQVACSDALFDLAVVEKTVPLISIPNVEGAVPRAHGYPEAQSPSLDGAQGSYPLHRSGSVTSPT